LETSTFQFDPAVYRLSAVKKAAYRYSRAYEIQIKQDMAGKICVTLIPIPDAGECTLAIQQFPREVLDQELREIVAEETSAVRDVLLAQAFSEVNLVDGIGESAEHLQDPLGIDAPALHGKRG
jgi:His-Xaa-Ser system protein HxsD